ncbi:MAG: 30S ribosomal protein S6 [bacterium]|nr:30S ribosomal protein S6 [bacterium]
MQTYEIGYLILPSIPENELSGITDAIKAVVEKAGGTVLDGEAPFKYDLSYTMTKTIGASRYVVSEAYLGWLKFEGEPEQAVAVKSGLDKIDELLRFLLVKASRETTFTFAKAREALEEKEEVGEPTSVEDSGVAKEAVVE